MKKLLSKVFPNQKRRKSQLLSKLIEKEFKESKPVFWRRVKKYFSNFYYPSKEPIRFIGILILVIIVFINSGKILTWIGLEEWILFSIPYYSRDSNHFQNLIAIHTGIGAIIFAFFIMVAESLRDNQNKDTAQVLLKVSHLFPLTVTEISVFILFLCCDATWLTELLIFGVAAATVFSLYRTINVLMDKHLFAQERLKFFKDYIKQNIRSEMEERVGNTILLRELNSPNSKIKYDLFPDEGDVIIKSTEFGLVTDIDLGLLDEIANLLEDEFQKKQLKENESRPTHQPVFERKNLSQQLQRDFQISVFKRYRARVSDNSAELLSFDKSFVEDGEIIKKIEQKVQNAFKIKPGENLDDKLQLQLAQLRAQFSDAINNHKLVEVEELIQTYIGITSAYFECMKPYGGGFSFAQARKEISSAWMGGWQQFSGLASVFRSLVTEAVENENKDILQKTINVPFTISRLALQNGDHYLFQKFNHFPQLFYKLSRDDDLAQEIREYLFMRSWESNRNLLTFYIKSKLTKPEINTEEKQSLKNFATSILVSYQGLMKDAFDQKDSTAVQKYQEVTLELFDFSHSLGDLHTIELRLKMTGLSPEQREQYQEQLKQLLSIKELSDRKLQMFFGLTSWVFDEYKHQPNDQALKAIYDSLQSIFDKKITEFTQIFLDSHSYDVDDFWGWGDWDMIADGKAHWIRILEKLEQFYAVKSLLLLARMPKEALEGIGLPFNRDLVNLAGGSRNLVKILDDIAEHPDDWAFVLSANEVDKVEVLKALLQDAKEKQEAKDLEELRRKPISLEKVEVFKKEFVRGFHENIGVRKMIEKFSTVEEDFSSELEEKKDRFGYNFVIDKTIFIKDEQVVFWDGGKEFGKKLANDESNDLINQLVGKCESLDLNEFESCFNNFPDPIQVTIFLINIYPQLPFGQSRKIYFERVENELDKYFYRYQDVEIPVVHFYDSSNERKIIVLDKRKIEKLIQFSPLDEGEDVKFMKDIFYMNIQSFSETEELLREYLDNPPEWLSEKGDEEVQKLYLQEIVRVKILERFELVLNDEYQGYQIIIEGEE